MPTDRLNADRIRELACRGAEQVLKQVRAEIIAIERTFPELKLPKYRRELRRSMEGARTRTSEISAAARKVISERMTKYWAERRRAQAKAR